MKRLITDFIQNSKIETHETGLYLIGNGDLIRLLKNYKEQLTPTEVCGHSEVCGHTAIDIFINHMSGKAYCVKCENFV